ncbi:hypothetical protein OE88DRAFT_1664501, partial [Heliocybe sulcata]
MRVWFRLPGLQAWHPFTRFIARLPCSPILSFMNMMIICDLMFGLLLLPWSPDCNFSLDRLISELRADFEDLLPNRMPSVYPVGPSLASPCPNRADEQARRRTRPACEARPDHNT